MNMHFKNPWIIRCILLFGSLIMLLPVIPAPYPWMVGPKDLLNGIGGAFLSTSIILMVVQSRIISEDITGFLVSLFTNSVFVRELSETKRQEVISCALKHNYPKLPNGYVDRHLDLLSDPHENYIESVVDTVTIRGDQLQMVKILHRDTCYVIGPLGGCTLIDFLKKNITMLVRMEGTGDTRRVEHLMIEVVRNKKSDHVIDIKGPLPMRVEHGAKQGFNVTYSIDWDKISRAAFDEASSYLLMPEDCVRVCFTDTRATGWQGALITRSFRNLVKSLRLTVHLEQMPGKCCTGRLFGNLVYQENYLRRVSANEISIEYSHWLFPGNGYAIAICEDNGDQRNSV